MTSDFLSKNVSTEISQKVKAVKEISAPEECKQFGIATYMRLFILHLSQHTAPPRRLICHKPKQPTNQELIKKKKKKKKRAQTSHDPPLIRKPSQRLDLICNKVMHTYFNPRLDSIFRVDSLLKGFKAALFQNEKPIAFTSKSLNEHYTNIEKEKLAILLGYEYFH